jgi:long-chain fatty acid transport protein
MKAPKQRAAAVVVAFALAPASALATNGYFSHGYGMKSKGMGGVAVALPQDAIAAAGNPAGMALVGNRVDFGLDIFRPQREAERAVDGRTFDANDDEYFLIPEFGYNRMLDARRSVGVSVYGNGGLNTAYNNNPYTPTGVRNGTGVDLAQVFIAPTFAMKVNDKNTVGVSINLAYQRFKAEGLNRAGFNQLSTDPGNVSNNGYDDSFGYGFSLGWIGQVAPNVKLGAMYRSRTWMDEFSDYSGLFAEHGDFDIPETYGVGISVEATPQMTVAFDIQQINYSSVDAIANDISPAFEQCFGALQATGAPSQDCLGGSSGPGFGWDDITVYKLGVDYQLRPNLLLRAGWNHGEQPIPSSQTTFNVLAPGVVKDHLTLGATWTLQNSSELTLAYMHAFENTVNAGSAPPNLSGYDLTMYQDSFGVAYGWKF